MAQYFLGQIKTRWYQYSVVRYTVVHIALGIINFSLAAALFGLGGLNHHIASLVGHLLHVSLAFFFDRGISFQSKQTTVAFGMPRYWTIEVISYSSIVVTMFIMVDLMRLDPYFSRGVVAMLIASAISYGLNRVWTFQGEEARH